ncbi:MAG: Na+/H+ antiporter NhaA [Microbacteriaceae bacterium]|nr:Na+/H+ antiporter NhaA [Microbacteriaceae bacterium]
MVRQRLTAWTKSVLRAELRAGFLTIAVAVIATIWVNSSIGDTYELFVDTKIPVFGLALSVHKWAADFLLAFFFFVVGIELRHEFTSGSLNSVRAASIPIAGALGGIVLPAALYTAFNAGTDTAVGWAIPAATDIAFALAVLAVVAPRAPVAVRAFLLTLAVVDDLGAITIIAVAYTPSVELVSLGAAVVALGAFAFLQRTRFAHPILLGVIGLAVWYFVYSSGVHATIAGVALGVVISTSKRKGASLAKRAMAIFHPFSSYVAVPLFVLVSAGIPFSVFTPEAITSPVFLGILVGLMVGKPLGIMLFVWVAERFFGGRRDDTMSWGNVALVSIVASIGFTVALLINDLAFGGSESGTIAIAAITVGAVLGSVASFGVSKIVSR